MNDNPLLRFNALPNPSVRVSLTISPDKTTFPLFSIVILYVITSPRSVLALLLMSATTAVLVTSKIGMLWVAEDVDVINTTVGSSIAFPSVSFPSSEVSDTLLVWPGLLAMATALLLTFCVLSTDDVIK